MNQDLCYDDIGEDGEDNKNAFEKLPVHLRYFVETTHKMIHSKVVANVKKLYGEEGCKDLVKTSGFRAISTNARAGGVTDSLHLFGCAIDYRKKGIFEKIPIPVCCNLEIIDSGRCWHVQLRRGK